MSLKKLEGNDSHYSLRITIEAYNPENNEMSETMHHFNVDRDYTKFVEVQQKVFNSLIETLYALGAEKIEEKKREMGL